MAAAVSFSRSRKPKVKWTNQMNNDVLECKRRAQELVASDSAPLNRNGRKKGYIEVTKQLWEEKGYGHLALKGQNLRLRGRSGATDWSRRSVKEDYGKVCHEGHQTGCYRCEWLFTSVRWL